MEEKEIKIVDTNNKREHGENRCPKCGASDVTYNTKKEKLVCNYCFTEFDPEEVVEIEKEAENLKGETRGSGTKDIKKDANNIITLKCGGCGAEVVINTEEQVNARCHWCRSILSINSQIDNGAVPDVVLPFKLEKKEAEEKIKKFVDKRQFFANPTFKKEFTTSNIMGVYFPYLLVDVNAHGNYKGEGEHEVRSYKVKKNDKEETRYDADVYEVNRTFDISIDDLTIESNSDRLNKKDKNRTNNVINAIMPFDTEKCVKYEANYLVGFSSEKRNVNINNIEDKVDKEVKDITRHTLNQEIEFYDRGVRWDEENLEIKGKQWISAYLPVWLYSYQDQKKVLHYVAVNARTGETMGSIPMNKTKLIITSILLEVVIFLLAYFINQSTDKTIAMLLYGFLITGPIYYFSKKSKYRNASARHHYEKETKNTLKNVKADDHLLHQETGLSSSTMLDANNHKLEGEYTNLKMD